MEETKTTEERLADFYARKKHQLGMGGEKKLAQRKAEGKLNVRERLDLLFDSGTFQEIGLFTHSILLDQAPQTPTDGKIIGTGLVNGRSAGTVANDLTIKGASSSSVNSSKMDYMRALSVKTGLPLIFLGESTGARMPDSMGAFAMVHGGNNPAQYMRLREAPWLTVLLGPCFGSSSFYSAMSDINVMLRSAMMGLVSPKVTELATGEKTPVEELCGSKLNAEVTGMVDAVCDTDEECIELAKRYFSYLPTHAQEPPPMAEVPAGSGADMKYIYDLVPEKRNRGYDMRLVLKTIFDINSFLELKADFGKPCITAFTRLGGRSVGVVATNPLFGAGALTVECCEKITSFLVLCDSYNLPILTFADNPGFSVGKEVERKKIMAKIINWMNALTLVSVPKITVFVRKIYGQAYLNLGGGKNSDHVVAWPSADISFMDPVTGINVVHGVRKEDDPERFEQLYKEFALETEPWLAAGIFGVQDIIDPRTTRDYLINILKIQTKKASNGVGQHRLANWPTSY